jgi:DNA polymerase III delta subunit
MIFVYYGPDYGLNSAKCVEAIKESLKNDIASLIKMDGNNDTILDLINECASISIFEDKKTILFSNATF